jgi:hypothetical protein
VPKTRLVAEMHTGLQHLAHADVTHCDLRFGLLSATGPMHQSAQL